MALLQSASGYGGLDNTPLARIGYSDVILEYIYERDFLAEITNQNIVGDQITQCNQVIQIMREPLVGPWRPYQKNQEMIPNQVSIDATCFSIDNAAYTAIKFDKQDIRDACERWPSFEAGFLRNTYQRWVELQRRWVFSEMIFQTAERNKGANAGTYKNLNLGAPGAPLTATPTNLPDVLYDLQRVLRETLRWIPGEMFIVLPSAWTGILARSNYANNAWTGDCVPCSFGIEGMWSNRIMGFNVIETEHLPTVQDPVTGDLTYTVIAGHRNAFAYAADIAESRIVELEKVFGIEYQMLALWGGKMLYPDAMAVGYWTLDRDAA